MARSVTVSVSMPPEMADEIDEQRKKYDMTLAEYVRTVLRNHEGTPFDPIGDDVFVAKDENGEISKTEGAA